MDLTERLDCGYNLCLGRDASVSEQACMREYLAAQKKLIGETPGTAAHWFPANLEGVNRNEPAARSGVEWRARC